MSLWSDIVNIADTFGGFVETVIPDLSISDAVNGALFGAVTSAIGGGDIGEAAAFGALGGVISGSGDDGIFGSFSNEIGGAVTGYGIDSSLGGNGITGAVTGAALSYLSDSVSDETSTAQSSSESSTESNVESSESSGDTVATKATESDPPKGMEKWLSDNGLTTTTIGTLGAAAIGAVGGYGAEVAKEDNLEKEYELIDESKRVTEELDEEFRQRNIGAFSSGNPLLVTRNG